MQNDTILLANSSFYLDNSWQLHSLRGELFFKDLLSGNCLQALSNFHKLLEKSHIKFIKELKRELALYTGKNCGDYMAKKRVKNKAGSKDGIVSLFIGNIAQLLLKNSHDRQELLQVADYYFNALQWLDEELKIYACFNLALIYHKIEEWQKCYDYLRQACIGEREPVICQQIELKLFHSWLQSLQEVLSDENFAAYGTETFVFVSAEKREQYQWLLEKTGRLIEGYIFEEFDRLPRIKQIVDFSRYHPDSELFENLIKRQLVGAAEQEKNELLFELARCYRTQAGAANDTASLCRLLRKEISVLAEISDSKFLLEKNIVEYLTAPIVRFNSQTDRDTRIDMCLSKVVLDRNELLLTVSRPLSTEQEIYFLQLAANNLLTYQIDKNDARVHEQLLLLYQKQEKLMLMSTAADLNNRPYFKNLGDLYYGWAALLTSEPKRNLLLKALEEYRVIADQNMDSRALDTLCRCYAQLNEFDQLDEQLSYCEQSNALSVDQWNSLGNFLRAMAVENNDFELCFYASRAYEKSLEEIYNRLTIINLMTLYRQLEDEQKMIALLYYCLDKDPFSLSLHVQLRKIMQGSIPAEYEE